MSDELILSVTVNGDAVRRLIPASRSLLDLLRDDLDLTGSKHGCDVGDCGACTVLVDDQPVLACITLAAQVNGAAIRTIEGVAVNGQLTPIQRAFDKHVASQCGYCTPGIVMTLTALLEEDADVDDAGLKNALGSNICRCTGYTKILLAAREAADETRRST